MIPPGLYLLFMAVAAIYSSVGLGGGTAYLGLLALSDFSYKEIPSIALLLNMVVASIGFYRYQKAGYFRPNILIPFMITSVPASFLGGLLSLTEKFYFSFVSITLFLVSLRMFFISYDTKVNQIFTQGKAWLLGLLCGAILGLLSGMIGIGGGIFLGPLLLLTGWASPKESACASSGIIIINSAVGFVAHSLKTGINLSLLLPLCGCVLAGSYLGSFVGAHKLSRGTLQRIFALILTVVAVRLGLRLL